MQENIAQQHVVATQRTQARMTSYYTDNKSISKW